MHWTETTHMNYGLILVQKSVNSIAFEERNHVHDLPLLH